ncbi:hypothetical protein DYI24_00825 [Rhodopseudomonas sp. BR0C11]|uniref:hypothetical protein n=1 Tax=Rhodopseudomonas sp. BR0C11 TaxID=2269370 RepID=UPI0013DF07B1|nr:hypothetical protein [Rhodopseudomonas sp. BR0C11]NEV75621.1 hypothetical protein [Rhodopseudomonas sp. BR0C11]
MTEDDKEFFGSLSGDVQRIEREAYKRGLLDAATQAFNVCAEAHHVTLGRKAMEAIEATAAGVV